MRIIPWDLRVPRSGLIPISRSAHSHQSEAGRVGCRCKANCPLAGPGPIEGVPSIGVFLRDPSPYLREFQRKLRRAWSSSVTWIWTRHLQSSSFELFCLRYFACLCFSCLKLLLNVHDKFWMKMFRQIKCCFVFINVQFFVLFFVFVKYTTRHNKLMNAVIIMKIKWSSSKFQKTNI